MRVVLDTNVVLDLLHFHDPNVASIDAAIRSGRVQAVTNAACLEELRRVLVYPKFGLAADAQPAVLLAYAGFVLVVESPPARPGEFPRCTDADDQKFIDLALQCGAAFLVSKDKALLRLARRVARTARLPGVTVACAIIAPRAFPAA